MVKDSKPRAGSMAFYPRVRARRIYPRINFPKSEKVKPLAFAGYKVGMVHVIAKDPVQTSLSYNEDIALPATIIEVPPLLVVGIRVYEKTTKGLKVFSEVWTKNLPPEIKRKIKTLNPHDIDKKLKEIENSLDKIEKVRLIVATQPKISGVRKKKPEVFEIEVGGNAKDAWEYAKQKLGKELDISEVFEEGVLVDVIGITKGKGTAGPVKRFGVKIQTRKAKKKRRHVGTLGSENPAKVLYTVPQAGQLGFQQRTEYNKRILKIGNGQEINPKSGHHKYGLVRTKYVLIHGSVPGPKKRLIILREAIRPHKLKKVIYPIKEVVYERG